MRYPVLPLGIDTPRLGSVPGSETKDHPEVRPVSSNFRILLLPLSVACDSLMFMIAAAPVDPALAALFEAPDADLFSGQCSLLLRVQVRLGRLLWRDLVRGAPYARFEGSLECWAAGFGLGPRTARLLVSLGSLLDRRPDLEPLVLTGRIDPEKAALLDSILTTDGAVYEGEDWVAAASGAWSPLERAEDARTNGRRSLAT
jgi:hypothetical protein